jgi:CBS domain-containing protein
MRVSDIMTKDVATAELETSLEEIATLMKEENVGAIPVLDDDGDLAGIITDRDIVIRCIAEGKDVTESRAEDILSEDCEVANPEMDVKEASQLMASRQIRRLPVVEDGKLIGMLSIGDVAVKTANDKMSGDALEKVSQGVKPSESASSAQGQSKGNRGGQMKDSGKANVGEVSESDAGVDATARDERHAGGSRSGVKNSKTGNTQAGKSSSGKSSGSQQNDFLRRSNGIDPEGDQSEQQDAPSIAGRSNEQGITNHSEAEENQRQAKVVPFRKDNEVRNKHVQPGKGGKRKSG